ncbi:MAG: hypothetical protein M0R74_19675, partial [Dehalococcoidia bacterium]|nr:hypothetical protein [Dehalococcoidia bacterium]
TRDRGPHLFQDRSPGEETTGLYVLPGDALALRRALECLLSDSDLRSQLGDAARRSALQHFTIERYTARLEHLLLGSTQPVAGPAVQA